MNWLLVIAGGMSLTGAAHGKSFLNQDRANLALVLQGP
jgi:hypothetical protein